MTATKPKRNRVIFDTGDKLMTQQSGKNECDVNVIVKNHAQGSLYSGLTPYAPTYGDATASTDLKQAIEMQRAARESFAELPSEVRSKCNNDPVEFLARLANREAAQELVELGLPLEEIEDDLEGKISAGVAEGIGAAMAEPPPEGKETD